MYHPHRRRLATTMIAALSALLMISGETPAASAAPNGPIVLFGDSMWSNGTGTFPSKMAELNQGSGKVGGNAPAQGRCKRGEARVGASLQRQTGVPVEDYACNGAVAYAPANGVNNVSAQIRRARAQGNLNPSTRAVFLNIGMLDNLWAPGLPATQTKNFVAAMRPEIDRIERSAPNAKIAFVGYPHMVDHIGQGCWLHVGALDRIAMPVPPLRMALDASHHWQRQAARATGIGWIDMEAATRSNGTCASPDKRYVSGLIDQTSRPYNMTTHLTEVGNEGVAGVLSRHI